MLLEEHSCGKPARHRTLRAGPRRKTTLRNLQVGDPIAIIYIPSATLARYGAGVAFNGTCMVFDVIPFYEVKSIWIGKSNEGKCLQIKDVERAYSRCVENEICAGFVGSSAIIFLQNIAKVIEESPETEAGYTRFERWWIAPANCMQYPRTHQPADGIRRAPGMYARRHACFFHRS